MKNEIKLDVKSGYDIWSKTYDVQKNPLIELEEPDLFAIIGKVKNKTILDAGCGTGRISLHLLKKGAKVHGIDIGPNMIKNAKMKTEQYKNRCEFKLASLYKIPYQKNSFDIVVSNLVLSHIKNLDKVVNEMTRVLKPNGVMVISDMHPFAMVLGAGTSYVQDKKAYRIKNYIHMFEDFIKVLNKNKLKLVEVREPKISKRIKRTIIELSKEYGDRNPEKEFNKWVGKPGAMIIKAKKM